MTQLDITALRTQLTEQRSRLLQQLQTLRGGNVGRAEASAEHFARSQDSDAQMATARDLELALDDHETQEVAAIDAALARIAAGTYGECVDCGAAITPQRLHAAPEAARCIHCQEAAEKA
ncbi:TraR/DksA family transcriptional regulator [Curvibacter sp. APW13]|uniref:TraR/DksA family transcriptional regulator n=1 Tax=Curvibacter sp. APW13 TaxID=3077236 RepID=UPI0028DD4EE9|nr:TraR/DksA family transcriptional regulator [Curvibacter sp. APW13]MDT8990818.1 TraR/DksA family transcriptional regulator [Curvibacter sp. APW13]